MNTDGKHAALARLALRSVQVVDGKLRISFLNRAGSGVRAC